jgi:pseudouridine synthase
MLERLQKILSARGIASRRKAEEYILAGLVKVNGKIAELGQKADPEVDTIEVDGQVLQERAEMLYYLVYKPVGIVTTNASTPAQKTVRDLLPKDLQGKIVPVGRLDKDSEGLLLMTNDGVLAFRLTHPQFDHEKEYEVTTKETITEGALDKLRKGIMLDGSKTKPATILKTGPNMFRITLTEGRNRQIRRMAERVGAEVVKLKRIRIMNIVDDALRPEKCRPLTKDERVALLKALGL